MKNWNSKETQLFDRFSKLLPDIFPQIFEQKKIAVAVSGGCDSTALALLLERFCKQHKISLIAVIVSHRFRKNSDQEAQETAKILQEHQILAQILYLQQEQLPKSNIEAKLRELRYEALIKFCKTNQIAAIFLGHHLNDLAENFLIRLFRGSHIDGLAAIATLRIYEDIFLVRPLLNFSKNELRKFLQQFRVNWQEDESNLDEAFLRNKIRRFLNELPESEIIARRIKKSAEAISESKKLIEEIIQIWQEKIFQNFPASSLENAQKNSESFAGIKKTFTKNLMSESSRKGASFQEKEYESLFLQGAFLDCIQLALCPKQLAIKILAEKIRQINGRNYKPRFGKLQKFYDFLLKPESRPKRYLQHQNCPEIYYLEGCQAILFKNFCGIFAQNPLFPSIPQTSKSISNDQPAKYAN